MTDENAGEGDTGAVWVVVLAAGDGTRLRSVTSDARGVAVPKQFCRLVGEETMLHTTLARAVRFAPRERIVVVVAQQHRAWWEEELRTLPRENVLVQPANKGTGVGIFLPLSSIYARDPGATVLILPSDHFVGDEEALQEAVREGIEILPRLGKTVLFGMTPEEPDIGYGWIVPDGEGDSLLPVFSFVEKPEPSVARALMAMGALWNSFLVAGTAQHLLSLYARTNPEILRGFLRAFPGPGGRWDPRDLARVYEGLPSRDFSRDVLQRVPEHLSVWSVPPCGWTDLGTPSRLAQCLSRFGNAGAFELASPRREEAAPLARAV